MENSIWVRKGGAQRERERERERGHGHRGGRGTCGSIEVGLVIGAAVTRATPFVHAYAFCSEYL